MGDIQRVEIELPTKSGFVTVAVISDVHWGSICCNEKAFAWALERHGHKEYNYFIFLGDILNCRWVKHKYFDFGTLHPRYHGDARFIDSQIDDLAEFVRKRIAPEQVIIWAEGNHETVMRSMINSGPTERILDKIGDVRFGGICGYVSIGLRSMTVRRRYDIYYHHGTKVSELEGTLITSYGRKTGYKDVDFFLYGHSHDLWVKPYLKTVVPHKGDKTKTVINWICNTGSFYDPSLAMQESPDYTQKKDYIKRPLGYVELKLPLVGEPVAIPRYWGAIN